MNEIPITISWKFDIIMPMRTNAIPEVSMSAAFRVHICSHLATCAPTS